MIRLFLILKDPEFSIIVYYMDYIFYIYILICLLNSYSIVIIQYEIIQILLLSFFIIFYFKDVESNMEIIKIKLTIRIIASSYLTI